MYMLNLSPHQLITREQWNYCRSTWLPPLVAIHHIYHPTRTGNSSHYTLWGWVWSSLSQTNIGTVSRATWWILLRETAEPVWAFSCTVMASSNHKHIMTNALCPMHSTVLETDQLTDWSCMLFNRPHEHEEMFLKPTSEQARRRTGMHQKVRGRPP